MNGQKSIFLILLLCALGPFAFGQKKKAKCKVLKTEIADHYRGSCKKGLAHGKGTAKGVDHYQGSFRGGLPNGKGTYTYANGEVYTGKWEKGMRHGEGRFTFKHEGKDSTTIGIWEEDVYVGPIPGKPYNVNYVTGVDRYTIIKKGEGERVLLKFRQSGVANNDIEQFAIQGSSGNQLNVSYARGFENIEEFPFKCRVRYETWNKLRTIKIPVIFDFEINNPGDWEVMLHN